MSYGINHQVGVKASPEAIYRALTETEKLAQWWTTDTRGKGAKIGDTLEFWFNGFCQRFNVNELKPGKRAAWKSPKGQGNNEWEETEVTFDLSTDEKQTFIQFRHSGWRRKYRLPGPLLDEMGRLFVELQRRNGEGKRASIPL